MPDVFDLSSDESAGETGSLSDPGLPAARLGPKRPRKRGPRNEYRAWICKSVLDCDLFHAESTDGLTVEEKTNLLKEHLRTRLNHDQPRAVLACAVLVDSSVYSGPPARFSIPVIFYVQTRSITAIPTVREPRAQRRHVQTRAMGGSPNLLEAGVEQRGPQSETGDCPISLSDNASDHDFVLFL